MASDPTVSVSTPGQRIREIDVLRGFALCGILVINVIQELIQVRAGGPRVFPVAIQVIFFERFLTIFGVLFGVGFGLFLHRARFRTGRPRLVLARRLAVLLVIGVVHFWFNPGDVLTSYAVVGLVVLIPVSFVGGRTALAIAVVLLLVLPQLEEGFGLVPGLLVLGYALAVLGVPDALARRPGRVAIGLAVFGGLAVGWAGVVLAEVDVPRINVLGGGLGGTQDLLGPLSALVTGLAYCCALLLLLRTRVGPVLDGVLAPMGRMALTNYLTATVLFLTLGPALGIDSLDDGAAIAVLTVGILVVQAVWSTLWLRAFRYGPVEWVWRCLTWWQRAPLRR